MSRTGDTHLFTYLRNKADINVQALFVCEFCIMTLCIVSGRWPQTREFSRFYRSMWQIASSGSIWIERHSLHRSTYWVVTFGSCIVIRKHIKSINTVESMRSVVSSNACHPVNRLLDLTGSNFRKKKPTINVQRWCSPHGDPSSTVTVVALRPQVESKHKCRQLLSETGSSPDSFASEPRNAMKSHSITVCGLRRQRCRSHCTDHPQLVSSKLTSHLTMTSLNVCYEYMICFICLLCL